MECNGHPMFTDAAAVERIFARTSYEGFGEDDAIIQPIAILHQGANVAIRLASEGDCFMNGQSALVFYGAVNYRGPFSGPHHTYFYTCWEWRNGRLMFSPVGPAGSIDYT